MSIHRFVNVKNTVDERPSTSNQKVRNKQNKNEIQPQSRYQLRRSVEDPPNLILGATPYPLANESIPISQQSKSLSSIKNTIHMNRKYHEKQESSGNWGSFQKPKKEKHTGPMMRSFHNHTNSLNERIPVLHKKSNNSSPENLWISESSPERAKNLAIKLERELLKNTVKKNRIEIFKKYFSIVIESDFMFGEVLLKIKQGYEEAEKEREKSNFEVLAENLTVKIDEMSFELNRVCKENARITEERNSVQKSLKERLEEIKLLREERGKRLKESSEEKSYKELCKALKKSHKTYKNKARKLLELVSVLKNKGIPVQEIYDEEVKQRSAGLKLSMNLQNKLNS